MLCPDCNTEINEEDLICPSCNKKLDHINQDTTLPAEFSLPVDSSLPVEDTVPAPPVSQSVPAPTLTPEPLPAITAPAVTIEENTQPQPIKNKISKNKKLIITILIIILAIIGLFFISRLFNGNDRSRVLVDIKPNEYSKFTIDGESFYIGSKSSSYKEKGYTYEDAKSNYSDYVVGDSLIPRTFNKDGRAMFFGAIYCPNSDRCSYDDTILAKANFYKDSKVVVNDYIKYGMTYDEITKKYGKETGKFYQDDGLLVWDFGDHGKIGNPYYILRFDKGGLFSTGGLIDIRMGVWWYDGEYDYTIIKATNKDDN